MLKKGLIKMAEIFRDECGGGQRKLGLVPVLSTLVGQDLEIGRGVCVQ